MTFGDRENVTEVRRESKTETTVRCDVIGGATSTAVLTRGLLLGVKPVARWARDAFYRIFSLVERSMNRRSGVLLPPARLRVYYYGTADRKVFARACTDARVELMSRGLKPEHRVLDIGSGIGNLAIGLVDYLRGGYDGVEIHSEAVAWCQQTITSRHPGFRFHRANLLSRAYNPHGHQISSTYQFPFLDREFDFIFLGSVFTHMLPQEVEQYLREVSRLLAPGGLCVASYFLLNDKSCPGVDAGHSFISFREEHSSGLCRLHDASVPEAAVALQETFVRRIHEQANLRIVDVRRGDWWNGAAHDQDVLTVARNS